MLKVDFGADPNTNPQTTTGAKKCDVVVDVGEWRSRNVKDAATLSKVGQRDLIFAKRNKTARTSHFASMSLSHGQVVSGFDGVPAGREHEYKCVGIACSPAAHQDDNPEKGALTGKSNFAIWQSGTNTILCNSRDVIPKFALLSWRIPIEPLGYDPLKIGRKLAEIVVYDPHETFNSNKIHTQLVKLQASRTSNQSSSGTLSVHIDREEHADSAFSAAIWENLKTIGYTMHLAALEAETGTAVSNQKKLELAELYRLIDVTALNSATANAKTNRAEKMDRLALSAVFQMELVGSASFSVPGLTAFAPVQLDSPVGDHRQSKIANLQTGQFDSLVSTIVDKFRRAQEDVFGYTPTGGEPGKAMDVVMFDK